MTISETKQAQDKNKELQVEIEALKTGQVKLKELIEQNNSFCNQKDAEIAELRKKLAIDEVKIAEINKNIEAKNKQVADMKKEMVTIKSSMTEKDVQLEQL